MSKMLYVSLSPSLSGSVMRDVFKQLGLAPINTSFTSWSGQNSLFFGPEQKYSSAVVAAERLDDLKSKFLELLTAALQPGSSVTFCAQKASDSRVERVLLLSGFVDVTTDATGKKSFCKTVIRAKTPAWELGAKAALKSHPKTAPATTPAPAAAPTPAATPAPAASKWTVAADDAEEDLIDEDDLLTAEDLKPAVVNKDDCEVGAGKKACKNCSCGRAEAEAETEAVKLTPEMLENPESACGSCYLGDAFRCASCPYRGLPAFERGQKIELPSSFLAADV